MEAIEWRCRQGINILDIQDRERKRLHAHPQPFTVTSGQMVHVDMNIFIGIR
jgi:hypothetical protein